MWAAERLARQQGQGGSVCMARCCPSPSAACARRPTCPRPQPSAPPQEVPLPQHHPARRHAGLALLRHLRPAAQGGQQHAGACVHGPLAPPAMPPTSHTLQPAGCRSDAADLLAPVPLSPSLNGRSWPRGWAWRSHCSSPWPLCRCSPPAAAPVSAAAGLPDTSPVAATAATATTAAAGRTPPEPGKLTSTAAVPPPPHPQFVVTANQPSSSYILPTQQQILCTCEARAAHRRHAAFPAAARAAAGVPASVPAARLALTPGRVLSRSGLCSRLALVYTRPPARAPRPHPAADGLLVILALESILVCLVETFKERRAAHARQRAARKRYLVRIRGCAASLVRLSAPPANATHRQPCCLTRFGPRPRW